jgi:hypothetical protein
MKAFFRRVTLVLAICISGGWIVTATLVTPDSTINSSQNREETSESKYLEVVVPDLATVFVEGKGSHTGQLTEFNSEKLTISAYGDSATFSTSDINRIEFKGTVWIPNPDGTMRELRRIRGVPIPIEEVPIAAFQLAESLHEATLNLETVLSEEEFAKLSREDDQIHSVKEIEFESPDTLTIFIAKTK